MKILNIICRLLWFRPNIWKIIDCTCSFQTNNQNKVTVLLLLLENFDWITIVSVFLCSQTLTSDIVSFDNWEMAFLWWKLCARVVLSPAISLVFTMIIACGCFDQIPMTTKPAVCQMQLSQNCSTMCPEPPKLQSDRTWLSMCVCVCVCYWIWYEWANICAL